MQTDPAAHPIHVIGTGRSGTTLVRMMLSAHPRIHLTHEASFYVWEALWGRRPASHFPSYYLRTPHFRWLGLPLDEILDAIPSPFAIEDRAELYGAVMRAAAARHGKPRWGDKTPSHSGSLARIFEDWPRAKVVRVVRDPRDTVASLNRMPWATSSLVGASAFCEMERRQVDPFRDQILEIRLEDLLQDPEAVMRQVLDHVGEGWSPEVLDHPHHAPDDLPPVPWFGRALNAIQARKPRGARAPSRAWRTTWTPVEIRMVEHIHRETLRTFSYEPASLTREPPRWRRWLRHARDLPAVLRSLWITVRLGMLARDARTFDGPKQKALFRRLNPAAWKNMPGFSGIPDPPALQGDARRLTSVDDLP